jgi:hypothetical protein
MHSCIYQGWVGHRRFRPTTNNFRYSLFQVYLDLSELDVVFEGSSLFSTRRNAPARFRREDHLGDPRTPLDECVRDEVQRQTGIRPAGPVRLLTNLRFWGYLINPVSYYYCFNAADTAVQFVLAEVHNTPWGERHCYVLSSPVNEHTGKSLPIANRKDFHVSPFMRMNMHYHWRITSPAERLFIHIENHEDTDAELPAEPLFDVTMRMVRREITPASLRAVLLRHPFVTAKVAAGIYWQALRLWWKKVPFVPHPRHQPAENAPSPHTTLVISDQPTAASN